MGQKLEQAGYPNLSKAVRPMAITSNERKAFLQVSFFHGVVSYNLKKEKVKRVTRLPNLVPNVPREQYLLDSAHHGIALSGNDKRLCIAGTMSSYAAVINRRSLRKPQLEPKLIQKGEKPYWSTTSENGRYCYVSWSGTDDISIISYRKRKETDHVDVGEPAGNRGPPAADPQRRRSPELPGRKRLETRAWHPSARDGEREDTTASRMSATLREGETVTPLELFFDLVFVLAITQCTQLMADEPTWEGIAKGLLVLAVLWWSWIGYAWLTSVVDPEEGAVRLVIFAAMAGLLVASICVPGAFDDSALIFAIAYARCQGGAHRPLLDRER